MNTNPDKPDEPDKLDKPDKLGKPDKPDESDKLGKPDKPDIPDKSDKLDKPDTPEKSEKPDIPNKPDKPDKSEKPEKSEKPDIPDKSDKSDIPVKSDKPDKPGEPDKSDDPVELQVIDWNDHHPEPNISSNNNDPGAIAEEKPIQNQSTDSFKNNENEIYGMGVVIGTNIDKPDDPVELQVVDWNDHHPDPNISSNNNLDSNPNDPGASAEEKPFQNQSTDSFKDKENEIYGMGVVIDTNLDKLEEPSDPVGLQDVDWNDHYTDPNITSRNNLNSNPNDLGVIFEEKLIQDQSTDSFKDKDHDIYGMEVATNFSDHDISTNNNLVTNPNDLGANAEEKSILSQSTDIFKADDSNAPEIVQAPVQPEDTYALLATSPFFSLTFAFSVFVVSTQIVSWTYLIDDFSDFQNTQNPFGVPADVEFHVRFVGFLGVLVAIFSQSDIVTSFNCIYFGFEYEPFRKYFGYRKFQYTRWVVSVFLRLFQGFLGLFTVLLIVIRSSTVVEMLLSFAAGEFITFIDDGKDEYSLLSFHNNSATDHF